jgi:hypothetical protein
MQMTPVELRAARARLGDMWGLGRPLKCSELGRAIGLSGRDPGQSIIDYERGKTPISGPIAFLVRVYLNGTLPPDGVGSIYKID